MMTPADYNRLRPGLVIGYHLPPSERPTHPEHIWRGRIDYVSRSGPNKMAGFCYVTVLDEGYYEMTEIVFFDMVVSIENEHTMGRDCGEVTQGD